MIREITMKRKWLAFGIILLFAGTYIIPAAAQNTQKQSSRGEWLYVGGSGPGNYTRIQDAINESSDGDTVFVYDDSSPYLENILIDKSISVVGEDCNSTVILGNSSTDIMNIIGERVNLTGFTIEVTNNDYYFSYLSIDANNTLICNNILKNITISSGR